MEHENFNIEETSNSDLGADIVSFLSGHSYFAKHLPTGEDWYILGIDVKGDRVCVAGWPATIGKLSDCKDFEVNKPLTDEELAYRVREFGQNWL